MGKLAHAWARWDRCAVDAPPQREGLVAPRLLDRAAPEEAPVRRGGERVAVVEPSVRRLPPGVQPGRPAPLLGRLARRRVTQAPSGPQRGDREPR